MLILCIRKGRSRAAFMHAARVAGVDLKPVKGLKRHFLLADDLPASIRDHPAVETVEDAGAPVRPASQAISIDETLTDGSWGIARSIRRDAPWNVDHLKPPFATYFRCIRDGTGVDWYSIDSGIRKTHDEFTSRVTNVYTPFTADADGDGHGSIVAACACGETVGIARGSLIWAFQWFGGGGGTTADVVNALGEALSHYQGRSGTDRPAVVNCSFTGSSSSVDAAVADMIDDGMVVVAAAGNDGIDMDSSTVIPAETTDVVAVGSMGMADLPAYFSRDDGSMSITNYGGAVAIMAPGQYVRAADANGDAAYLRSAGSTSCACAYTSGVVACMLQGHSRLADRADVQAVRTALLANATTGRFRAQSHWGIGTLPDRILYLDPDQTAPETIAGL